MVCVSTVTNALKVLLNTCLLFTCRYVEPLPPGSTSKFEFENQIVGQAIPSGFIPAIEKGFKEAANSWVSNYLKFCWLELSILTALSILIGPIVFCLHPVCDLSSRYYLFVHIRRKELIVLCSLLQKWAGFLNIYIYANIRD